jgi:hypothetical protein
MWFHPGPMHFLKRSFEFFKDYEKQKKSLFFYKELLRENFIHEKL